MAARTTININHMGGFIATKNPYFPRDLMKGLLRELVRDINLSTASKMEDKLESVGFDLGGEGGY